MNKDRIRWNLVYTKKVPGKILGEKNKHSSKNVYKAAIQMPSQA